MVLYGYFYIAQTAKHAAFYWDCIKSVILNSCVKNCSAEGLHVKLFLRALFR